MCESVDLDRTWPLLAGSPVAAEGTLMKRETPESHLGGKLEAVFWEVCRVNADGCPVHGIPPDDAWSVRLGTRRAGLRKNPDAPRWVSLDRRTHVAWEFRPRHLGGFPGREPLFIQPEAVGVALGS